MLKLYASTHIEMHQYAHVYVEREQNQRGKIEKQRK